jgi:hypothetical protein
MNKYRLKCDYDEFSTFVCLNCKKDFICQGNPSSEGWTSCHFCGAKWDGAFTLKHKRYPIPYRDSKHDYISGKDSRIFWSKRPRLIIEERSLMKERLRNDSFAVESCPGYFTQWHLRTHCEIGLVIENKSSCVWMFKSFKRYIDEKRANNELVLRLLEGLDSKVLIHVKVNH